MDDSEIENTAVIRMKRGLDTFLSGARRTPFQDQKSHKMKPLQDDVSFRKVPVKSFKLIPLEESETSLLAGQSTSARMSFSMAETTSKRIKLELQTEVEMLREEKRVMAEQMSDLKTKLLLLAEKERNSREQAKEGLEEFFKYKTTHSETLMSEERQKLKLKEEVKKCNEKITDLNSDLHVLQSEIEMMKTEALEAQSKLDFDMEGPNDELREELHVYRQRVTQAEIMIRDLENQLEEHKDEIAIAKTCKLKVEKYPQLEKLVKILTEDNEKLRDNEVNIMKMEEKMEGLQKKLVRSEDRVKELSQRDVSFINDDQSKRWTSCKLCGSKESQSTADLLKQIQDLKSLQINQVEKHGEVNSRLRQSEDNLREFRTKYSQTQENLDKAVIDGQKLTDLVKRLQRKLLLITKEREGYKKILESYESEVTLNINPGASSMTQTQPLEDLIKSYKRQYETLETENQQQLEKIAELKKQLTKSSRQSSSPNSNISLKSDLDSISELKENVISLECRLQKAEEENNTLKARMEQRHLQGDYDPTKTKIVHFTMNPADNAQKKREESIEALRNENEKLKQRLEILESAKGQVEDLTLQVEEKLQHPSSNKQVEEITAQVKREELKNKRLMEAFKKTSQEFREVCCRMLGFKIDITGNSQYRLTSIYSESNKDFLMFQQSSSGDIQMLETDFSETLQDLIDIYLVKQDSVPSFLSSVTLDLFSRQTMNMG